MTALGLRLARVASTFSYDDTSAVLEAACGLLAAHVAAGGTYVDTTPYPEDTAAGAMQPLAFMGRVLAAFAAQAPDDFAKLELAATVDAQALVSSGTAALDELLGALGVEKLAYTLVAGVDAQSWPELRAAGVLGELAASGKAGKAGALVLDWLDLPPLLDTVLDGAPEFSHVQLHYDPVAWDDKGLRLRETYTSCWTHERKVIATHPMRGGYLANPPEVVAAEFAKAGGSESPAYWALRFAADEAQVELVSVATSQLEHLAEAQRALAVDELLTLGERNACLRAGRATRDMKEIDCIGCRRCVGACPNQIPIPQLFSLYNAHVRDASDPDPQRMYWAYQRKGNVASACDNNRRCIPVCPKAIQIPAMLDLVAETFEK